ncbi:hypothetical protein MTR67_022697 [Solanum verrucosum]|uniref:Uncharacterized protein n=1 Tax=Solanum verrucosum TaxID=315347 RepID=A0AAF0QVC3_SOLVR|nr:hypothetical protein MTR67_022697 [Solanum verrucosum]
MVCNLKGAAAMARIKVHELRNKSKTDLLAQLKDLRRSLLFSMLQRSKSQLLEKFTRTRSTCLLRKVWPALVVWWPDLIVRWLRPLLMWRLKEERKIVMVCDGDEDGDKRFASVHVWRCNEQVRPFIHKSRILGVYSNKGRIFTFTLTCKLNTVKGNKPSKEKRPISVSGYDGVAPPVVELEEGSVGNGGRKVEETKNGVVGFGIVKKLPRKVLGILSNCLCLLLRCLLLLP